MRIEKVLSLTKRKLEFEPTGHDYSHALRVRKNALKLCQGMNVNQEIVEVAALVHDLIDYKLEPDYKLTINTLEEYLIQFGYGKREISLILSIITNMSYSSKRNPDSIEGKIVQDADRLDALGAIGIARTFAYSGRTGRLIYGSSNNDDSVSHFYDKLFKLTDLMNTEMAKKIALKRTIFMKEYLRQLDTEI